MFARMQRIGSVAVIAVIVVTGISGTSGAIGSRPAPVVVDAAYGVNGDYLFDSKYDWAAHLAAASSVGFHVMRRELNWNDIEPSAPNLFTGIHTYQWTAYDAWMAALSRARVQWQPILGYSAQWASSVPYLGRDSQFYKPARNSDFAAYAFAVAQRYGRGGAFWSAHPELPYDPIVTYEVWNEENSYGFWHFVSAGDYAGLLVATVSALRLSDPNAGVLLGGLARADATTSNGVTTAFAKDSDYLAEVLTAAPQLATQLTGVGYHPYAGTEAGRVSEVVERTAALRHAMQALGVNLPLYLTEVGWSTFGSDSGRGANLTEAERADALAITAALVRSNCNVRQYLAYTWVSPETSGTAAASAESWFGIASATGSLKASATRLGQAVAELRTGSSEAAMAPVISAC